MWHSFKFDIFLHIFFSLWQGCHEGRGKQRACKHPLEKVIPPPKFLFILLKIKKVTTFEHLSIKPFWQGKEYASKNCIFVYLCVSLTDKRFYQTSALLWWPVKFCWLGLATEIRMGYDVDLILKLFFLFLFFPRCRPRSSCRERCRWRGPKPKPWSNPKFSSVGSSVN